jgi:transcriptional regulator with XRE-family HTH domain
MTGVDGFVGDSIGERIQQLRERRKMSRAVVASLVGRSAEWLKSVERGKIHAPRPDMLIKIAEVLGLKDLAELTGSPDSSLRLDIAGRAAHDAVPAVRAAIEKQHLTVGDGPAPDLQRLTQRVADAWALWHSSGAPRTAVGALLPQIITDGRRASRVLEGLDRRRAYAALSAAYALSE